MVWIMNHVRCNIDWNVIDVKFKFAQFYQIGEKNVLKNQNVKLEWPRHTAENLDLKGKMKKEFN